MPAGISVGRKKNVRDNSVKRVPGTPAVWGPDWGSMWVRVAPNRTNFNQGIFKVGKTFCLFDLGEQKPDLNV